MPDRRTLIEKLHRPEAPRASEHAQFTQSIAHNLSLIFGSFPGSMKAELPGDRVTYGMPTLGVTLHPKQVGRAESGGEHEDPELRDDLPTQIRNLVRAYEPRLRPESISVEVRSDALHPGRLIVSISASMWRGQADVGPFRMDAALTSDGRIHAEPR